MGMMGDNLQETGPGLMARLRLAMLRRPVPAAGSAAPARDCDGLPSQSLHLPASRLTSRPPATLPAEDPGPATEDAQTVASGLRLRVLLPLAGALLLLIATFVIIFIAETRQRHADDIARTATTLELLLRTRSSEAAEMMQSLIATAMSDRRLEQGLRARDRLALLDATGPLFEQLRQRNRITHLYFILPDRTTLLRAHAPGQHGDRVNRLVLQEAERTGQAAWGNEQGPLGSYTLRVVRPWHSRGELIGYLELGIEFEDLMQGLHAVLDVESYVAIDKRYVDQAQWEAAQKQAAQDTRKPSADWNEFPNVVLVSRTTRTVPPPVARHLRQLDGGHAKDSFEIEWDGQVAQAIVLPFANLRGQQLGELVVLRDITTAALERRHAIAATAVAALLIGALMMVMFHALLGRAQRDVAARTARLAEAQRILTAEHMERIRAQRELGLQRERNQLLEARGHMFNDLLSAKRALEDRTDELAYSVSLLHATLDSTADGILAATFADGTVRANAQLAHMWGLSQETLDRGVDAELYARMARQMKEPERFIAEIEDMYACPEEEAVDLIELKDGRRFERCVKPQRINGKTVGVVINFRDITERQRVQAPWQATGRESGAQQRPRGDTGPATLPDLEGPLASMGMAAEAIEGRLRVSKAASLARTVKLLQEHADDLGGFLTGNADGRMVLAHLEDLAAALQAEHAGLLDEARTLARGVDRLRQAAAPEAVPAHVVELLRVDDLLNEAAGAASAATGHDGVNVSMEPGDVPALPLDRQRLLPILTGLVTWARQAARAADDRLPQVVLRARRLNGQTLRIEVQDNGEGASPEDLARLFTATTTLGAERTEPAAAPPREGPPGPPDRPSGDSTPAQPAGGPVNLRPLQQAARELGGVLSARSDGPGHGITVTLDLPVEALETVV